MICFSAGKLRVHHYHIHRTEAGTNLSNGHANGGGPGVPANGSAGNSALTNGGNGGQVNGGVNTGAGAGSGGEAQFYLSEKHAFPTISEVIHYHKHNSGGLVVRLRSPPVKDRESPVTAGMGLDEFELDPAELQIDPEPIGKGQFGVRIIILTLCASITTVLWFMARFAVSFHFKYFMYCIDVLQMAFWKSLPPFFFLIGSLRSLFS